MVVFVFSGWVGRVGLRAGASTMYTESSLSVSSLYRLHRPLSSPFALRLHPSTSSHSPSHGHAKLVHCAVSPSLEAIIHGITWLTYFLAFMRFFGGGSGGRTFFGGLGGTAERSFRGRFTVPSFGGGFLAITLAGAAVAFFGFGFGAAADLEALPLAPPLSHLSCPTASSSSRLWLFCSPSSYKIK